MTANLLAFLLARIAEDEADAKAAESGPWSFYEFPEGVPQSDMVNSASGTVVAEVVSGRGVRHIARHDPARVLAECAAKRAIVERWQRMQARVEAEADPVKRERLALTRHGLDAAVDLLAQPYAGHPDYDEAWRPAD